MNIKGLLGSKSAKDSFVYLFSDVINKAIPFLLLPILTSYLSPDDYGTIATFNSFMGAVSMFIGLSLLGSISVNYYKLEKKELAKYVGNVIIIFVMAYLLVTLIVLLFKDILFDKIGLSYPWIIVATTVSFFSFIIGVNTSLWLVEQKPKSYSLYNVFAMLLIMGLSLFFVIILSMSWQGRILGIAIGTIIGSIINLYFLYKRGYMIISYNKEYVKEALEFGVPLIPHQLGFWLKNGAVIFLLAYFVGKKETGLYNIGFQFVLPLSVLMLSFNKAWVPYLYRKLSTEPKIKEKQNIVRFTYFYFLGINVLAILLIIVSPFVIDFMLAKEFSDAYIYIIYLAFGVAFQGMYLMVVNYIFYTKKTKYLSYITLTASVINVVLAYFLIKINGSIGAAQASVFSSIITFIGAWFYSNKVYKMPWFNFVKLK